MAVEARAINPALGDVVAKQTPLTNQEDARALREPSKFLMRGFGRLI